MLDTILCTQCDGREQPTVRFFTTFGETVDVQFVMFKESGERKSFALHNETTIVGRREDCDIRIPLPEVSRRHAEINVSEDGVKLKDLGSANGTYVNNKRVEEKELVAGDHLVFGPIVFTVQIDGQPEDIKPVKTRMRKRSRFSPEDNLARDLEPTPENIASGSLGLSDDSRALEALDASSDISSLSFEFDDLDLSDSEVKDG